VTSALHRLHAPSARCAGAFVLASLLIVPAANSANDSQCILEAVVSAPDDTTVGELRAQCAETVMEPRVAPASDTRRALEAATLEESFLLTAHRPTYILPITYNSSPNQAPFTGAVQGDLLDEEEAKFQISFKLPLWRNPLGIDDADLYFAFTSQSYWQVYNTDNSSPFRESNYEPEVFLRHYGGPSILGLDVIGWDVGLNHQSNGRAEPLSRSWNRAIAQVGLQVTDDIVLGMRAWYRLPENAEDDNNPNEYRYLGYGDLRAVWTPGLSTWTLMVRPGTEGTGVEATWSYPLTRILRAYVQYYDGYGESLLDYDHHVRRIGLGVALSDYLQR
jgi:phospholipase A1